MEKRKVTLKDYLDSIDLPNPKPLMIARIAKECGVSKVTVYRWVSGKVIPDKLKKEKIAEITGVGVDELF